jgi:hypothetical protein
MGFSLDEIEGMTEAEIDGYVEAYIRIRSGRDGSKPYRVRRNRK